MPTKGAEWVALLTKPRNTTGDGQKLTALRDAHELWSETVPNLPTSALASHVACQRTPTEKRSEVGSRLCRYAPRRGITMSFCSRNSSIPWRPPSRPSPDCLTPPKGVAGLETMPAFKPTMPTSSASETANARSTS